jgi:hypothetical protein
VSVVAEANKLATSVPTWKNIENAKSTTVITKLSNYVQLFQEQSSRQLSRLEQGLKSRRASVERRECKSGAFKSLCLPQWFTRDKSVFAKLGCSRYEPWHWRFVGSPEAQVIFRNKVSK